MQIYRYRLKYSIMMNLLQRRISKMFQQFLKNSLTIEFHIKKRRKFNVILQMNEIKNVSAQHSLSRKNFEHLTTSQTTYPETSIKIHKLKLYNEPSKLSCNIRTHSSNNVGNLEFTLNP